MAFALVDLLLYTFMRDMLVCYRCRPDIAERCSATSTRLSILN